MSIRSVFGPHWLRLTGSYTIFVDVIGFPRKCVYDCIYCPVNVTPTKTVQPISLVPPETIYNDLKWFIEHVANGFDVVTLYGTGDPWLNPWLPLIIDKIIEEIKNINSSIKLYAITTGHLLSRKWSIHALKKLDRVYVRIDGFGEDYLSINNPHPEAKLRKLIEVLRGVRREFGVDKIHYVITLLESNGFSNANIDSLEQIAGFLSMVKAENVFIKTVHRPSRNTSVKPVSRKKYLFARDFLEEKGFNVYVEDNEVKSFTGRISFNIDLLYNHLTRKPLTLKEIMLFYGLKINDAAGFLGLLENKGLVTKIPWRTSVFYRGIISVK